jgi:glutaredoxin
LQAWAESLGGITYPLLSDFFPHGRVAQLYGVLRPEGKSERAIFVIDKNCVIRYVDVHDIDEQPDNEVLFGVLEQIEEVKTTRPAPQPQPAGPLPQPPGADEADLVMYCNQWCPACRRARVFLQQYGIKFVEIDIARNREAAAQIRRWNNGNETTPTFDVKGKIIANFKQSELAEALGITEN